MGNSLKAFVVAHTHWDREWYLTFQEFRIKLIKLVDSVLDTLQSDEQFKYFTLDGQTILLNDYLEISPDRRPELEDLISSGRILVGPWYVLPDEFLVSAESLVRNLQLGHRIASGFGGLMKVGYLPDSFGHISQMPQILKGFGIDSAVVWRGVDDIAGKSEFIWRAPDGSEVLAIYLPDGYANAAVLPESSGQLANRLQQIVIHLEEYATTANVLIMNGNDHLLPDPTLPEKLARANSGLTNIEIVQGTLPSFIKAVREAGAKRRGLWKSIQGEFRGSRRAHLLAGVLSARMWVKQRNTECQNLLEKWAEPFSAFAVATESSSNGIASAKKREHTSRAILIEEAWRYLLQNHPHDSICGCSIDQVHEEMRIRFDSSRQIAEVVTAESLDSIAGRIDKNRLPSTPDESAEVQFTVFNPDHGPRTDFVVFKTQLPATITTDFVLTDESDNPIPCQIVGQKQSDLVGGDVSCEEVANLLNLVSGGNTTHWTKDKIQALEGLLGLMVSESMTGFAITGIELRPSLHEKTVEADILVSEFGAHNYPSVRRGLKEISALVAKGDVEFFRLKVKRRDEVDIGFVARNVPSYGYRTYQVSAGHRAGSTAPQAGPNYFISNEFFSVQASPFDGTLAVIDKETGAVDEGMNLFVDEGDAGDEYNYSPPADNPLVSSPLKGPKIAVTENGPVRSTLKIEIVYCLPMALSEGRQERSEYKVEVPITTYVSLYAGVKRIDIRTEFNNKSSDHRLRVHFPTRIKTDRAYAEEHFGVIARALPILESTSEWLERPIGTQPQKAFVDVSDGNVGLMIANKGLPEYEVIPGEGGTVIALTLLRCVGWLSRDDLNTRRGNAGPSIPTPGAQCQGPQVFDYAIIPHAGTWQNGFQQAHWFNSPMRAVRLNGGGGSLPLTESFIDLQPGTLVISAIKQSVSREGTIVRVYNPTPGRIDGTLRVAIPFKTAVVTDLNELPTGVSLVVREGQISLSLRGGEVLTVLLED